MPRRYDAYVAASGFDGDLHAKIEATNPDEFALDESLMIVPRTKGKTVRQIAKIAAQRLRRLADRIEKQTKLP
jgi:hypothetical protein